LTAGQRVTTDETQLFVSAWIKTPAIEAGSRIIGGEWLTAGNNRQWLFFVQSTGKLAFIQSSDGVASEQKASTDLIDDDECNVKYVHVRGAIFFSSARNFVNMFSVADDPEIVVIDLKDGLVIDHSAVAAIQGITRRFEQVGKRVLLTNVPHKSVGRLHRTGDHSVLKRQMTHELVLEGRDGTGGVVDEATVGNVYSNLPMFDVSTEPIDNQLSQLEIDQGTVVTAVKKED
jgi:MFS superfamily sulfate permease-like transporter